MTSWEFNHFDKRLERIEKLILEIKQKETHIMSQLDDLNAQITAVTTAVNQLGTDLTASIADLQAKITAAGTPIDLTAQIASLQGIATQLTTMDAADKGL